MPHVGAMQYCNSGGRIWFEVEVVEAQGFLVAGLMGTNARKLQDLYERGMAWLVTALHSNGEHKPVGMNGRVPPVALGPCSCAA